MKKYLIAVAVLLSLGFAQAAETPTFPAESKVKILRLQLDRANAISEYRQMQARMKEIETQVPKIDQDLQVAVEEAYRVAKVDKKDYTVDMQKVDFVAVQKPEAKKP